MTVATRLWIEINPTPAVISPPIGNAAQNTINASRFDRRNSVVMDALRQVPTYAIIVRVWVYNTATLLFGKECSPVRTPRF